MDAGSDVGPAVIGLLFGLEMMRRIDPDRVTDELAVRSLRGVVDADHIDPTPRDESTMSDTLRDTPTLDDIDLLAETWTRREPHDQFDLLRREAPVFWHPEPDGPGFWAVTKHADVRTVSHDWETYSSEAGRHVHPDPGRGGPRPAAPDRS